MSTLALVLGVIAGALMLIGVVVLLVTVLRGRLSTLGHWLIIAGAFVLAAALALHLLA